MLSIELRVNGQPVCMVSAHRGEPLAPMPEPTPFYDFDMIERMTFRYPYHALVVSNDGKALSSTRYAGAVGHEYRKGIVGLCRAILADIENAMKAPKTSNEKKPPAKGSSRRGAASSSRSARKRTGSIGRSSKPRTSSSAGGSTSFGGVTAPGTK